MNGGKGRGTVLEQAEEAALEKRHTYLRRSIERGVQGPRDSECNQQAGLESEQAGPLGCIK